MSRTPVHHLILLGAVVPALAGCVDEESPEVRTWKSNIHSHQHGDLQHSHPHSGAHTHEGMRNGEEYLPFYSSPRDPSDETPVDVATLAAESGSARGQPIRVRGELLSLVAQGEHCLVALGSLSQTNVEIVVETTPSFCTTLRSDVGRTLIVSGTVPVEGGGGVVEAKQIEVETAEQ